ncbi:MAG: sensor histidine kinase [Thiobacillus sp.]
MFARLRQLSRTSALRLALRYALLNVAVLAVALAVLFVVVTHYVDRQIESALSGELAALASLPAEHRVESVRVLSALRGEERQLRYYRLEAAGGQMVAGNITVWPTRLPVDGVVRMAELKVAGMDHDDEAIMALSAVAKQLPDGGRLLVAQAPGALEDLREIALGLAAAALGIAALLSLALGVSLGWHWLQRIDAINRTAGKIAAGDLTQRVEVSGRGDEFDLLAGHLNRMLARIEAAVTGMREVSDNVAHDLRKPLTRLRTRIDVVLNQPRDAADYCAALADTAADADELMHNFDALLSIARLEAGSDITTLQNFDLAALTRSVTELYADEAEEAARPFSVNLPETLTVRGQSALIAQALANLLDNAFKYTSPDVAVKVTLTQENDHAVLSVSDYGKGIPIHDLARMTERFTRGDEARTKAGSGLGLALVKAVMYAHGGELKMDNLRGGGLIASLFFAAV